MDWLGDNAWAVWLAVSIALGAAETLSLDFVLLMLAAGAAGGMVTALVGATLPIQLLVAAVVSAGMLVVVRPPVLRRLHSGPELSLGHGKLVGARGVVTARATGLEVGRVRLEGEEWSASPYDETLELEPGQTVEVFEIRGATAYVHPVATLEP